MEDSGKPVMKKAGRKKGRMGLVGEMEYDPDWKNSKPKAIVCDIVKEALIKQACTIFRQI